MSETRDQLRQQLTWERQRRKLSEKRCAEAEAMLARIQDAEFVERVAAGVRTQRKAQMRERHSLVSASAMADTE